MERKIGKKFKLRNSILRETIAEFAGTFILMVMLIQYIILQWKPFNVYQLVYAIK
jgi:hypothetical protein